MTVFKYRFIYGDTDQMGVVYYANYLRLFEMGRNEYMRRTGTTYKEVEARGLMLPVTRAELSYRKSGKYDDLVDIETKVAKAKGARVVFSYDIKDQDGNVLVSGMTEHAVVDMEGRVVRLPGELIAALGPEE